MRKKRLLDELEWYRPPETIFSRLNSSANFGNGGVRLLGVIADGRLRSGD